MTCELTQYSDLRGRWSCRPEEEAQLMCTYRIIDEYSPLCLLPATGWSATRRSYGKMPLCSAVPQIDRSVVLYFQGGTRTELSESQVAYHYACSLHEVLSVLLVKVRFKTRCTNEIVVQVTLNII